MDIKQLEYLIDIAELKSVTRAAEKNFMSQSTLSREVKILEKRIGVNLFVWDNREMRLTEEGILYLNGAHALLQEYKKGMKALERLKAKQHQVIHLILSPKVQYFFRSHIQPEFVRQFPHTSLEVTVGSFSMAEEYLEHGFADLAITATHTPEKLQSEAILLHREAYFLSLPASHPAVSAIRNQTFSFPMLDQTPFLLTKGNNVFRKMEQDALSCNHFFPSITYEVETLHTIRKMISEGLGVGFLPEDLTKDEQLNLCFFPLKPAMHVSTMLLLSRTNIHKNSTLALRQLILQKFLYFEKFNQQ